MVHYPGASNSRKLLPLLGLKAEGSEQLLHARESCSSLRQPPDRALACGRGKQSTNHDLAKGDSE